jgi:hypothetical protein
MKRKQACLLSFILAHFGSLSESGVVCVGLAAVCLAGLWPTHEVLFSVFSLRAVGPVGRRLCL